MKSVFKELNRSKTNRQNIRHRKNVEQIPVKLDKNTENPSDRKILIDLLNNQHEKLVEIRKKNSIDKILVTPNLEETINIIDSNFNTVSNELQSLTRKMSSQDKLIRKSSKDKIEPIKPMKPMKPIKRNSRMAVISAPKK